MDEFTKSLITKIVGGIVVMILLYFLVLAPILKKLGIIKTAEDKAKEKQTEAFGTQQDSPFSPNYYKSVGAGAVLVQKAVALDISKQIYDAIGVFHWTGLGDDEAKVYGALKQLKAKTQLSWVADVFQQKYNKDLYLYLVDNLGDDEMNTVNEIAKNML